MTPEEMKEYQREYRAKHREELLRKHREYWRLNAHWINKRKRLKYRDDPAYRYRELERKRKQRERA